MEAAICYWPASLPWQCATAGRGSRAKPAMSWTLGQRKRRKGLYLNDLLRSMLPSFPEIHHVPYHHPVSNFYYKDFGRQSTSKLQHGCSIKLSETILDWTVKQNSPKVASVAYSMLKTEPNSGWFQVVLVNVTVSWSGKLKYWEPRTWPPPSFHSTPISTKPAVDAWQFS